MNKGKLPVRLRNQIIKRANGCCEYCYSQARYATYSFTIEHIRPLSLGGTDDLANLALACQGCNSHKYTKTTGVDPLSGDQAPLFHPRQQIWHDHFAWDSDYRMIIGLTPTGRCTVETLRLHRESLRNLRSILFAAGKHPPASP